MTEQTAPVTGADNAPTGAQFTVEKIYVKDVSFEAPNAPQIFNEQGQPQLNMNLNQKVGRLDGDLMHASAESIERYIAKQNRYTTLQADALHARGKRSSGFAMAASPIARFFRFYVLKLGFLDGAPGFAHIAIGAFASFLKHAKLRALERAARNP